jgi:hypothetical protein
MGPHLLPSVAYREGDAASPSAITRLAPTLGQHNDEVLRGLLGLGDAEMEQLRSAEIIGDTAIAKTPKAGPATARAPAGQPGDSG